MDLPFRIVYEFIALKRDGIPNRKARMPHKLDKRPDAASFLTLECLRDGFQERCIFRFREGQGRRFIYLDRA